MEVQAGPFASLPVDCQLAAVTLLYYLAPLGEPLLAAAAALERDAIEAGDAGMLQEAQEILAQPIVAPTVVVAPIAPTPKLAGGTFHDNWKPRQPIDLKALVKAAAKDDTLLPFLMANLSVINKYADVAKDVIAVPGIRFYNDRYLVQRQTK